MTDTTVAAATAEPASAPIADTPATTAAPATETSPSIGHNQGPTLDEIYDKHTAPQDDAAAPLTRAPDGKFAPKDGAPPDPALAADKVDQKPDAKPEDQAPTLAAPLPRSWSPDKADTWSKLPPEAQQYVAQREQQFGDGLSRLGQQVKEARSVAAPFVDVVRSHAPWLQEKGLDPARVFDSLITFQRGWELDKVGTIYQLMEQAGIDPLEFAAQPPTKFDKKALDTTLELDRRAMQVARLEAQQKQAKEAEVSAEFQQWSNGVRSIASELPHFAAVSDHVYGLIPTLFKQNPNASPAEVLKAAYEQAVWSNPATRQAALKAERDASEAKAKAEATARATDARKAASQAKQAASININGAAIAHQHLDLNSGYDAIMAKYGIQ